MRINFTAAVLSLAMASSVYAAPAAPVRLDKRNWVTDKLKGLLSEALSTLECGACVAALVGVKDVGLLNKNWALDAVNELCPSLSKQSADVCSGLVYSQGSVLLDSLLAADLTGGDGKEICFQILGACPAPAIASGTLTFPKPRPANPVVPAPSGNQVDVLHLSDWHVDAQYTPGSEGACNKPVCCRKYADSPASPTRAVSSWGDYNCDSPVKLGQDLLKYVPTVAKPSFAILTGDVPPHDIWLENQTSVVPEEAAAYNIMASLGINIYPTVGNHEAGPPNLFPTKASGGDISWLYSSLANDWSHWLPADAVNSVKNYGAYTVSPTPGFRIISLNTNFCYSMNLYLYGHTKDYDPNGELKWLITQLQAAEDAGERVWIIGHVGPSQTDCLQNWSALYYQVVQRYSPHVIAEQFFGHTHYDEFALYYGPGAKSTQNAISTAWIGPSVTPYTDLNPGFRVYKVDTKSWNVFDAQTYVADLNQAASWDASGSSPNWHLEYSARKAYGAYAPIADNAPLSASWWHNVTTTFESNSAAFQQYWTYRGKSANKIAACATGSTCQTEMICDLRAGKSSDSCTKISFALKKRAEADSSDHGHDDLPQAKDTSSWGKLFKRDSKPWNKKLCGTF
ncbi:Metallo-dependent phosphatase-like protein [Gamsiella multidivaricata]|uniref:Metallo-dependent phosphatase-like protein n=1 Tax=Gamsiella multidivaricata TaxID=101098 RepID=UPI00221F3C41|nr:Metallo-dependent phosphatase-like protein [Gamsiella multidivaricata]KAG0355265.1 hypothetical protein BGZ54_001240 [Gamsiella multidivaricata]KAI7820915.1 Metallo-dependent phosphatase-like protein [Gamsiella multidivaricata]